MPGPNVASSAPTVKTAVMSGYGAFDAMMFAGFTASYAAWSPRKSRRSTSSGRSAPAYSTGETARMFPNTSGYFAPKYAAHPPPFE